MCVEGRSVNSFSTSVFWGNKNLPDGVYFTLSVKIFKLLYRFSSN